MLALGASEARAVQVSLTWADGSNNESGFKIERATGSGAFAQIATVTANVVSYIDTGVSTGGTYNYRVRAYNSAGDSGIEHGLGDPSAVLESA